MHVPASVMLDQSLNRAIESGSILAIQIEEGQELGHSEPRSTLRSNSRNSEKIFLEQAFMHVKGETASVGEPCPPHGP